MLTSPTSRDLPGRVGGLLVFAFALTIDGRGTALEVRAPEAAQTLVSSLSEIPA